MDIKKAKEIAYYMEQLEYYSDLVNELKHRGFGNHFSIYRGKTKLVNLDGDSEQVLIKFYNDRIEQINKIIEEM